MKVVESTVRTNKLWCSTCKKKISKGENAVFTLNDSEEMEAVEHLGCIDSYTEYHLIEGSEHPLSSDALKQS